MYYANYTIMKILIILMGIFSLKICPSKLSGYKKVTTYVFPKATYQYHTTMAVTLRNGDAITKIGRF